MLFYNTEFTVCLKDNIMNISQLYGTFNGL